MRYTLLLLITLMVTTSATFSQTTTGGDSLSHIQPYWSPDGEEIIFTSMRSGINEIYIVDRNGENLRKIEIHE